MEVLIILNKDDIIPSVVQEYVLFGLLNSK